MPIESRTYACNVCGSKYSGMGNEEEFRCAEERAIGCEGRSFTLMDIPAGVVFRTNIFQVPNLHRESLIYPVQEEPGFLNYAIVGNSTVILDGFRLRHNRVHDVFTLSNSAVNDKKAYDWHNCKNVLYGHQIPHLLEQTNYSGGNSLERASEEDVERIISALEVFFSSGRFSGKPINRLPEGIKENPSVLREINRSFPLFLKQEA